MKRARMFLAAGFIAFLLSTPYAVNAQMMEHMNGGGKEKAEGQESEAADDLGASTVKEAEEGRVTVKIEYKNPGVSAPPVFAISFDTHSVELDQYMFEGVTSLRDAFGRVSKAALVSTSGSGHHREATLVFQDADLSSSSFMEVIIKGVAGVKERIFKFDLSKE